MALTEQNLRAMSSREIAENLIERQCDDQLHYRPYYTLTFSGIRADNQSAEQVKTALADLLDIVRAAHLTETLRADKGFQRAVGKSLDAALKGKP